MANIDPLFLLIKSLFQSDKKNFIRYSSAKSGKEETKYLKLFRELDKASLYDEAGIKTKLKITNFPEAKRRLIEQLLESLINYDESITDSLTMERFKIEELYHRGIYSIAIKRLKKALTKAYDEERFSLVLEFSDMINRVLLESEEYEKLGDELSAKFLGRDVARDQLSNLLAFKDLFNFFYPTFKKYFTARGRVEMDLIDKLSKHPLLKGPNMALSSRAMIYFYRLKYIILLFKSDFKSSLECSYEIIEIFNSNPHLIKEDPKYFIQEIGHQSNLYFFLGEMEKGMSTLDALKRIKPTSKLMEAEIFEAILKARLAYDLAQKNHKKLLLEIPEIKKQLSEYEGLLRIEAKYLIHFSLANILYKSGLVGDAIKSIRMIVDRPHPGIRTDLQSVSRIILLLFYLESSEFSLAESLARSTSKYLKKTGKLFKFEQRMLKFVNSFPLPQNKKEQLQEYSVLREDLREMFNQPFEAKVINYFDFNDWIENRIQSIKKGNL